MTVADLLADAFGRIHETVHEAVDGLTPGQLVFRPESGANSTSITSALRTRSPVSL